MLISDIIIKIKYYPGRLFCPILLNLDKYEAV